MRSVLHNPWIPADHRRPNPRQLDFLALDCLEAMYGGAAGGGKSDALLMAALQYVDVPGYSAILFRQTYTDLALSGALMDRAADWLRDAEVDGQKVRWDGTNKTWHFPSGASLSFGYLEHPGAERRYKSAEFQFVGFDELTEFAETPYRFLFSRLRRPATGELAEVPLRMRSATNPGGPGHEWVKKRFIPDAFLDLDDDARFGRTWWTEGRAFVPARLDDNPHVDAAAYELSLAQLDPLTRAWLRRGDWRALAGGRFQEAWFRNRWQPVGVDYRLGTTVLHAKECPVFLTVDPAATEKTAAKEDPDYTVICAWAKTPDHQLLWLDCERHRIEVPDIIPAVQRVYDKWLAQYVAVEGGGTQKALYQFLKRTRMAAKELLPGGQDKLARATPLIILCESGRVWLPGRGAWVEEALGELLRFTGNAKKDGHDDVVDAAAYAARLMTAAQAQTHKGFRPHVYGGGG
jgi:predicted phage terminase large subunit-like protein